MWKEVVVACSGVLFQAFPKGLRKTSKSLNILPPGRESNLVPEFEAEVLTIELLCLVIS
jgi:hypothetical protein